MRRFSPEEDEKLRAHVEAGHSYAAIGEALDRAYVVVWRRAKLLGLKKRRANALSPEREAIMRRMWTDGAPVRAISSELGVTVRAVLQLRDRLGLPPRPVGGVKGPRSLDYLKVLARMRRFDEPQPIPVICEGLRLRRPGIKVLPKLVLHGVVVASGPKGARRYMLAEKVVEK